MFSPLYINDIRIFDTIVCDENSICQDEKPYKPYVGVNKINEQNNFSYTLGYINTGNMELFGRYNDQMNSWLCTCDTFKIFQTPSCSDEGVDFVDSYLIFYDGFLKDSDTKNRYEFEKIDKKGT